VCSLLGVLPQAGTQFNQRALANLTRGELLCQAFEVYQQLMRSHAISFEHAVFLVTALARGDELALSNCGGCGAVIVLKPIICKGFPANESGSCICGHDQSLDLRDRIHATS
jgi:hypothetical protein